MIEGREINQVREREEIRVVKKQAEMDETGRDVGTGRQKVSMKSQRGGEERQAERWK